MLSDAGVDGAGIELQGRHAMELGGSGDGHDESGVRMAASARDAHARASRAHAKDGGEPHALRSESRKDEGGGDAQGLRTQGKKDEGDRASGGHAGKALGKGATAPSSSSSPEVGQQQKQQMASKKGKEKVTGESSSTARKRSRVVGKIKNKGKAKREKNEDGYVSSGDDYASDLLDNYIGQCGALAAMGLEAKDVLNENVWWNKLTEDEQEHLYAFLPPGNPDERESMALSVLWGEKIHFGSPRDALWDEVVAGFTHPRIQRWRQKLIITQRRQYLLTLRDYHNSFRRHVLAFKKPLDDALIEEVTAPDSASQVAPMFDARGAVPDSSLLVATGYNQAFADWNEERWRRVEDFRRQEAQRYQHPEKAWVYKNYWGNSVVAPLRRGPGQAGVRPRDHFLLKEDRPSIVTILCLVRDAASRLPHGRGTRLEIDDLLRESQYLREGASATQLNSIVSGALDRLRYEPAPCVRFESETKTWHYLHNDRDVSSYSLPQWARPKSAATPASKTND
ncbi:Nuclear factor related to kappa-B-binding protein [Porphyridium purpureum]|uniref:Nuclear factor related to kappa-B-binding protein n=1 Tax=Porphyridium purpureum TaxID=35688 RepID=A0A5J4YQ02_PORPP|nr:Nuclear factor related to kappa-B-binding protein [Porphyridium purpureum]|eukprot:POR1588..scf296_7